MKPRGPERKVLKVVRRVAGQTTHGFRDDNLSMPELRQKLASGEQILASCGTIARLTRKELRSRGIKSRVVGTVTKQPFDGENDGHIMVEARANKKTPWSLYDPDMNQQPLDRKGRTMNIQQFTNKGYSGRYRKLANDAPDAYDSPGAVPEGTTPETIAKWRTESDPKTFYNRVLGTPYIEKGGSQGQRALYRGKDPRLAANPYYALQGKHRWRKLMGK